jgi:hypothetical protein
MYRATAMYGSWLYCSKNLRGRIADGRRGSRAQPCAAVHAQERSVLRLAASEGRAPPHLASAAATVPATPRYARPVPERTLLYALVEAHYPDFLARLQGEDRVLREYVREEFDDYLRCGVLEHGLLRVVCEHCHAERRA